jgi:2-alkyl-3-oxoalkanoate reductase
MEGTCLITGASGFIGGHLVEACAARGLATRALVRPASNLDHIPPGVELVMGDLTNAEVLRRAVVGVDTVFHCGAKVGDWGSVEGYRYVNVDGLSHLLDACRGARLKRFVHFSTLGVYAARHHHGTDERTPPATHHIDGYTQSKAEAECLALEAASEHGVPVVVLRPGFVYGPRDRCVLPRLIDNLRAGIVRYLGNGLQALNTIYVHNLVDAAFLAARAPAAEVIGQVYNLTDGEYVSKRQFIEKVCDGFDLPRPRRSLPLFAARLIAWMLEGAARRRNSAQAPRLTQARLKFLGLHLDFSIERARRQLGYSPRYSFAEGMAETIAWYHDTEKMTPLARAAG